MYIMHQGACALSTVYREFLIEKREGKALIILRFLAFKEITLV